MTSAVTHPSGKAAIVSFDAPLDDGGHTITSYAVFAYAASTLGSALTIGGVSSWSGALSPITVPGVQDGTDYWFTVKATNLIADVNTGTGAESTAGVQLMSGKVPDAPTGVYGISLDSEVQLTWVAPVDIGGSALLHYTIYTTPAIDSSCGDVGDIARCESLQHGVWV